jgi:hypothetical protein
LLQTLDTNATPGTIDMPSSKPVFFRRLIFAVVSKQADDLPIKRCFKSIPSYNKLSAAYNQRFNIQFHQMLEIGVQLILGKIGEKFRLGASVNLTDAIDNFPFAHNGILQNF